jgi:hypothetical protein
MHALIYYYGSELLVRYYIAIYISRYFSYVSYAFIVDPLPHFENSHALILCVQVKDETSYQGRVELATLTRDIGNTEETGGH